MGVQDIADFPHLIKATRNTLFAVRLLFEMSPDPQRIAHDGMHCLTPSRVDRERGWIHVRSAVTSFVLWGRIWIVSNRFQDIPCGATEFKGHFCQPSFAF